MLIKFGVYCYGLRWKSCYKLIVRVVKYVLVTISYYHLTQSIEMPAEFINKLAKMFYDMHISNDVNNLFKQTREGESSGKFNQFFKEYVLHQILNKFFSLLRYN